MRRFSVRSMLVFTSAAAVLLALNFNSRVYVGPPALFQRGASFVSADMVCLRRGWPFDFLQYTYFPPSGTGNQVIADGWPWKRTSGRPKVTHPHLLALNVVICALLCFGVSYLEWRLFQRRRRATPAIDSSYPSNAT